MTSHTIGEVLNRLKDEFEDITISKIRFLEAEGLIHPDRTESGYRKFDDDDVDRLRYVLRAQRDRYLPLKVIKDELQRLDAGMPLEQPVAGDVAQAPTDSAAAAGGEGPGLMGAPATDVSLSATELAGAADLDLATIRELVDNGLLPPGDRFDGHGLRAARIVAQLMASGLEPRHLRMFVHFADRQVALLEQLVAPLLRQRNPDARRSAAEQAERLAESGAQLHRVLLARRLHELLRS